MTEGWAAGRVVGGWTLVEPIGRGGMGEVWVAERDGARAALKLIHARPDRREAAARRFEREVGAAARIGHPRIVQVRDFGVTDDGAMYLVMELLDGEPLRAWLDRDRAAPAPRDARPGVALIRALLDPLAAAHACEEDGAPRPIVHRDLKPENVFVGPGGEVTLLDFGIARQVGGTDATDTGVGLGTAGYMSPEQATDARKVGPASDVWSVGVMLYELLAGERPFEAPSRNEVISQILTEDPIAIERRVAVPEAIAALVASCLDKDPARRPPDASALRARLDEALEERGAARALAHLAPAPARDAARPSSRTTRSHGDGPQDDRSSDDRSRDDRSSDDRSRDDRSSDDRSSDDRSSDDARRSAAGRLAARAGLLQVAAVALVIAALALPVWWMTRGPTAPTASPGDPTTAPRGEPDGGIDEALREEGPNPFVRIAPSDTPLGIGEDPNADVSGFRPAANVRGPTDAYAIQEHEITWAELEPWLTDRGERPAILGDAPPWLPTEPEARGALPATGVRWATARAYCESLGGDLPTEAQWEHAARGPDRAPYPWGDGPLDPEGTNAGPDADARPWRVATSVQDTTRDGVLDMAGNAREWTRDLFRASHDGTVGEWVEADGRSHRAVRGLPLLTASRWRPPDEAPVAHRVPLCAEGDCPPGTDVIAQDVGFRCVRESSHVR